MVGALTKSKWLGLKRYLLTQPDKHQQQTSVSSALVAIEVEEMSDESTKHETGSHVILIIACNVRRFSHCVQAQGTESHLALIWCHCLFFHLSAKEVMQTPQIVWLMATTLHINSIHCLCELRLPLTLIKYWYPCKHSCHIEYFIQSPSLPLQCGMSCCSLEK